MGPSNPIFSQIIFKLFTEFLPLDNFTQVDLSDNDY